jgi:hypothetical protein
MRSHTVAAGVTLALVSVVLPGVSVAQGAASWIPQSASATGIPLESLQACLDQRGYGQRLWSATELARETTACLNSLSQAPNCPASPFSLGVAASFRYGEPHPTWSANDRARLADQLPQWINEVLRQMPRVHDAAQAQNMAPWQLEVAVRYAGSGWSQRDLDDWIRQPRSLQVDLSLRERNTGAIKDQRELKLSFPPQLRARDADTSGARWLAQLQTGVREATENMLSALACVPDVLAVSPAAGDRLRISFGDRRLRPNETEFQVVLLSAEGQLPAALWPIGRVTALGIFEGELTLLEGEDDVCQREACVALPR